MWVADLSSIDSAPMFTVLALIWSITKSRFYTSLGIRKSLQNAASLVTLTVRIAFLKRVVMTVSITMIKRLMHLVAYQCICHRWAGETCCCCCSLHCWPPALSAATADWTEQAPMLTPLHLLLKWTSHCPPDRCWPPSSCSSSSCWAVDSWLC